MLSLENHTILCFASGYDAPPTSKHHVMHLLAERNRVLWVNYHASRAPSASSSDLVHIARKLSQVFAGLTCPRKNLHVLTPLVVPLPASAAARRLNRWMLVQQIRRALTRVGRGPVQLWSFTPDVAYLLGSFGEEKVVYYCVDDHAQFTGYDTRQVLRDEEELCRRVDLVVTTSMVLQEAKSPLNPNTILVPHGVDYAHFSQALRDDLPVPADIAGIPHPRLGFFGLIRDWVDLDLLAAVARQRPEWHFVLIGDWTLDLAPYRVLSNMHFLGRKPYAELPAYCRQFDVGLIPFKLNDLTRAVNPIKLREYLAAGLPVVSTPLPEVRLYEHLVNIGDGPEAFSRSIELSLNGPAERAAARSAAMARETWPAKLAEIDERLQHSETAPVPLPSGPAEAPEISADNDQHRQPAAARRPRVAIATAGGGFGAQVAQLILECPNNVELILLSPPHLVGRDKRWFGHKASKIVRIGWGSRLRRGDSWLRHLVLAPQGFIGAFQILRAERPDWVIMIAQRYSFYMLLCARTLGIHSIFIDSLTRVNRPSVTGRIVARLRLANHVFCQWPGAASGTPGAEYAGRLI